MRNFMAKIFLLILLVTLALPAQAQTTFVDRFLGSVVATIGKQPVIAATTGAITLSYSQVIDGVTVSDHMSDGTGQKPDRVLVKNQADQTTNGIYVVNNTGAWTRAQDFTGPSGVVKGQLIMVVSGTQAGFWDITTADPIVIGSTGGLTSIPSNITFTQTAIPVGNLALPNGNVFVGNTGGTASGVPLSGDCSMSNTGAITCTKTNGVSFSSSATLAAVNGLCQVGVGGQWVAGSCSGPTGTGTVTTSTAGQIAYYAASNNVVVGTSAMPNGITATTQTTGDTTAKVATDAFTVNTITSTLASPVALANGSTATTQTLTDNSTNLATTAFVQANISGTGFTGFRNRIINGDMRLDQRNAGSAQTITTTGAYTVDRWLAYTQGANATGQRIAGTSVDQYAYKFTGAASVTSINFAQRIESGNIYDQEGQTMTLSAKLADSTLTSVGWIACYPTASDNYASCTQFASGSFTVNSTLTRYSTQLTLPANAVNGVEILFFVGAQTSGTWTIEQVQLEPGSSATPFERLPVPTEIILCQRYYEVGDGWVGSGNNVSSTQIVGSAYFKVTKRVAPTVSAPGAAAIGTPTVNSFPVYLNLSNGFANEQFTFTASSEL